MKMLVVGGGRGLGKEIVDFFNADSIRYSDNIIPQDIAEQSKNYDVVINCVPRHPDQYEIMHYVTKENITAYHITIGGFFKEPEDIRENKRPIYNRHQEIIWSNLPVKHTLLNPAWLWNSPDDAKCEKISKKDILNTIEFLIKFKDNDSVISRLDIKGKRIENVN